jgi:CRISPR-associated protein Csb2
MLALRIDLLTGRYVATAYNDRTLAEWPPHPARVFSALVAVHHSAGTADAAERDALEWLAALSPPALCASGVSTRASVPVFVPVNDVGLLPDFSGDVIDLRSAEDDLGQVRERLTGAGQDPKSVARELAKAEKQLAKQRARFESRVASALAVAEPTTAALEMAKAVLPEGRRRQPRMFPSVSPHLPVVHLVWPDAQPTATDRASLDAIARRVTRIGHSSSLVACRLVDDPPPVDWLPSASGELVLRVTSAGQLQRLEEDFVRHREEQPRTLPSNLQSYTRPAHETVTPVPVMGDDWIVFRRVEGPGLPTRRTADLATVLRETLMRFADQPPQEILTGHGPNGEPSGVPHVAYLALPFLGGPHPDGSLLGVAVVFPRGVTAEDRTHVLRAIGTWEQRSGQDAEDGEPPVVPLLLGRAGTLRLQRIRGAVPLRNLDPTLWCRESRSWATVTPIALDRNPGNLRAREAEEAAQAVRNAVGCIGQSCRQIGLPSPESIGVSALSSFRGPESSVVYPPFPKERDRFRRVLVHANITFEHLVRGPILLGAGRYRGLGLCMPRWGEE